MLKLRIIWLRLFGRKAPKGFCPQCATEYYRDSRGRLYMIAQTFDQGYSITQNLIEHYTTITKGYRLIYRVNRDKADDLTDAAWAVSRLIDSRNRRRAAAGGRLQKLQAATF